MLGSRGSQAARLVAVSRRSYLMGSTGGANEIDLRSDTVTRPCAKMRDAMANAVVGDDIYSDCPTTNKLQKDVAELLGKEAALFVSSGTMANCASMMTLAQTKGDSVILGNWSHIANYERGGISGMGGIMPWVIANNTDGTLPLD